MAIAIVQDDGLHVLDARVGLNKTSKVLANSVTELISSVFKTDDELENHPNDASGTGMAI